MTPMQKCQIAETNADHTTDTPAWHACTFVVDETEPITDKHNIGNSTITVHKTPVTTTVKLTIYISTSGTLWQSCSKLTHKCKKTGD